MKRCVNEQSSNDSIWKARRARRWWASVLKNHFTPVRTQDTFILKGDVGVAVMANILMLEFFVLAVVQVGLVTMLL